MTETAPATAETRPALDRRTIVALWRNAVLAKRTYPAYLVESEGDWREVSWEEADERVRELANGLLARGVKKGDTFAILAQTGLEWALLDFALAQVGAVSVPIYANSAPADVQYLLEHSEAWFRSWLERARASLAQSSDRRASRLRRCLQGYDEVIGSLAALPRTFVHGELYPSNVLIAREGGSTEVYPVDWEMAAVGPGVIDLAAMVAGWDPAERRGLIAAYAEGVGDEAEGRADELLAALARGRLHLALQWLGWAEGWTPPPEHATDWLGEALGAAAELGLA